MRLAALYDIHGNLPALEATLAEVAEADVDALVVGGDVVPGAMSRATLDRLAGLVPAVRFLRGNGEADVLAVHRGESVARVPEAVRDGIRRCVEELGAVGLAELSRWPSEVRIRHPRLGEVLFCHATPRDDNEIFTRRTPEERLRPLFESAGADVVVCGHTHMPFDRRIGRVRVVNAGSVGMPFGEPGAYWALLGADVELRRTRYDLAAAARRLAATGFPSSGYDLLRPPSEERMHETFERVALRG